MEAGEDAVRLSMAAFNLHSLGVAILGDLLAQRLAVEYAEGAFAAGLFHDLGWLLVAIGLPEEFKQISLLCRQSEKWANEYEVQLLGMTHAELSADALAAWNLPEPIQTPCDITPRCTWTLPRPNQAGSL